MKLKIKSNHAIAHVECELKIEDMMQIINASTLTCALWARCSLARSADLFSKENSTIRRCN